MSLWFVVHISIKTFKKAVRYLQYWNVFISSLHLDFGHPYNIPLTYHAALLIPSPAPSLPSPSICILCCGDSDAKLYYCSYSCSIMPALHLSSSSHVHVVPFILFVVAVNPHRRVLHFGRRFVERVFAVACLPVFFP